jgi:hypothetical protein
MRRAMPWRYLPWIARDYFLWGGVATAVIMIFIALGFMELLIAEGMRFDAAHPLRAASPATVRRVEASLILILTTAGPLIAMFGVASRDRTLGYFRLLFARPLNAPLYYAIVFAVNGLGFMLVGVVLQAAFSLFVVGVPIRFLAVMGLSYLFYGGIMFLISALWRYEVLSILAIYLAAATSWDLMTTNSSLGWLTRVRWLLELLPPVHLHDNLIVAAASGRFTWTPVAWWGIYGLACFGLGLLTIRYRQFAKGT